MATSTDADFLLSRLREWGVAAMGTPAWDLALSANRPTLLDVRWDPNVPPIPPHATVDQMFGAAKAMLAGDEDRWGVLTEGIKTTLQEFLPQRGTR